VQSIASPLRLQESGLLRREDRSASVLSLLQMMARTPQGSWRACPEFGLRDLFEDGRSRADLPRLVADRINRAFADLGLPEYQASEVVRELSLDRGTDTYSIRLENQSTAESLTTTVAYEI
jgi:hypothetical protein